MEAQQSAKIVNRAGLHARPCQMIAAAAMESKSELQVACGGPGVNGRSILELMTLQAGPGTSLELTARGPDAEALVERLVALVAEGFGESI